MSKIETYAPKKEFIKPRDIKDGKVPSYEVINFDGTEEGLNFVRSFVKDKLGWKHKNKVSGKWHIAILVKMKPRAYRMCQPGYYIMKKRINRDDLFFPLSKDVLNEFYDKCEKN